MTIHLQFAESLADFDGDVSTLAGARPLLEECLAHGGLHRPHLEWAEQGDLAALGGGDGAGPSSVFTWLGSSRSALAGAR